MFLGLDFYDRFVKFVGLNLFWVMVDSLILDFIYCDYILFDVFVIFY